MGIVKTLFLKRVNQLSKHFYILILYPHPLLGEFTLFTLKKTNM